MGSPGSRIRRREKRSEIRGAAATRLLPMLIEPYPETSEEEFKHILESIKAEDIKSIYNRQVFAKIPVIGVKDIAKFAKLRNLDSQTSLVTPHDVLMVKSVILEQALSQSAKVRKNQPKGQELIEILKDSEKSRSRFKGSISSAHYNFSEDQKDIFWDAAELLGLKELLSKMIDITEKQIQLHSTHDKLYTAKLQKLLKVLLEKRDR